MFEVHECSTFQWVRKYIEFEYYRGADSFQWIFVW